MKKTRQNQAQHWFITLLITLLVIILQWVNPAWLQRIEGIAYDFKLVNLPIHAAKNTTNIQIVDIDEQSLKTLGRWPWPRKYLAQLTHQLTAQGAVVIAFDMLFSEPQQNPVTSVEQALRDNGITLNLNAIKQQLDNDSLFAQSIANNDVVLGTLFQHNKNLQQGSILAPAIEQPNAAIHHLLPTYQGYNASIAKLNQVAQGQGFINAVIDQDGFIRRTALLSEYHGTLYPSLALETYRVYSFAEKISPQWHHQGKVSLLSGLKIGKTIIATDNKAQLLIPFRTKTHAFPFTSASDVITKKITDKRFNGAVVFVGSSAVGLSDLRTTPVSLVYPGVAIHASIFSALMQPENQITQPEWWLGANVVLLILFAFIFQFIIARLSPLNMSILALISISLLISFNSMLWYYQHIHLPIIPLLLLPLILFSLAISQGFYRENKQRKQVKAIFDQYVPPAHIEHLLNDPNALSMLGVRKELTVLFADIRNFTTISEKLSATQLKTLLNNYFSPITEVIFKHQGTIDKYVGDMVMAFWGAPIADENHAQHAIDSAFSMLTVTKTLNKQFKQQQLPLINIGIGINTGEMNVGDMGSTFRRAYTVLGDAVNLGSRLESLTKYYGVTILVSEFTKKQCPQYQFQCIDKVQVKGKQEAVTIYLPIQPASSHQELEAVTLFNQMFEYYQTQQFSHAENLLAQYKQINGENKLTQIYQSRLSNFKHNPPNKLWNGVFTHHNK